MKRLLTRCVVAFGAVPPVAAQETQERLDVPTWFDKCTALSSTLIANEMDTRCMSSAYDYCELGHPPLERRVCIEKLNAHLLAKTKEIAEGLPDQVVGLSGFSKWSYPRRLEEFRNDEFDPDCSQMTEFMCETFSIVVRSSAARELERLSDAPGGSEAE